MKNLEIAKIFYDIADILDMKDVQWKPQAYRKAARSLETLGKDVESIENLDDIPGVGKGLAKKIKEYIETGKIKEYDKLKKRLPKHLIDLLDVPGLGPKRVKVLYNKLKIDSLGKLEEAAKEGRISKLEGFDKKLESDILEGMGLVKISKKRDLLGRVLPLAEDLKIKLKELEGVKKVEIAGSLARRKETIGDVDILVISKRDVLKEFVKFPEVKKVLAIGSTKASVILKNGLQVDVRLLNEKAFGSGLMYFIGSKDHNVELRKIAIKKGYKLSEYGLFKGKKLVAGRTEKDIYRKLGMQFVPAEMRENKGEIELALKKKIPKLIELNDINGDMHVHTNYSEGNHSLKETVMEAKNRGYKFINITDHAKNLAVGGGMDENKIKKQIREIDSLKINGFKVLKGVELNIDKKGGVDFSNKILKELDCAVAGVHSSFKMSEKEMTSRICKAMENEYVKVIAHPTGRLLLKREAYKVDISKLIDKAKETGTILEIDGTPARLDLNDDNIREAVSKNLKLSIGSDAHALSDLDFIRYGVFNARRGWATKKDIVNCWSLKSLMKYLNT